jgi:hypothetical protein
MAGVAGDMHFAVGELPVDVFHHLEHDAGRQFRGLFIARPVLHVAVVAHHRRLCKKNYGENRGYKKEWAHRDKFISKVRVRQFNFFDDILMVALAFNILNG